MRLSVIVDKTGMDSKKRVGRIRDFLKWKVQVLLFVQRILKGLLLAPAEAFNLRPKLLMQVLAF